MSTQLQPVQRMTYTIVEAAIMLGISRTTAYRLAAEDRFPVPIIHVGEQLRVSAPALDELLARQHAGVEAE